MAASKVNTRFVWGLVAVLCVLFAGVAGVLLVVQSRSAEVNVRRGDRKMQEGDYEAAEKFYSQAVNKQQQNVAWLNKWREAMIRKPLKTEGQYNDDFGWLVRIHRALAVAAKTDVAAHRAYLDILLRQAEGVGGVREAWDGLVEQADLSLRYFTERDGTGWHVLRRYRGLALTNLAGFERDVTPEQAAAAKADLEAALAAEPGDGASAGAYQFWCLREAEGARAGRDEAGEAAAVERGRAAGVRAAQASPRDPRAVLAPLRFETDVALRVPAGEDPSQRHAGRRARLDALKPRLDETTAALGAADPARMDMSRMLEYLTIAEAIDPGKGSDRALALMDAVLAARPDAADIMFIRGRMLAGRGDHEGAIAQFQKIVELPTPPVSYEGMMLLSLRTAAVFAQANAALVLASETEGPARAAADARADEFRAALARRVPEGAPELLFLDGKRAAARNDLATAQSLLDSYSRVTADRTFEAFEALWLGGQVAMQRGQPGLAVDLFRRAADRRPDAMIARVALGNALSQLQRYDEARRVFELVLEVDPTNQEARERADLLRAMQSNPDSISDPIRRALVEAEQLNSGNPRPPRDPEAAMRVLERAIAAHGAAPELSIFLAGLRSENNNASGAREALRAGLEKTPDHPRMKQLLAQLEAGESLEAALRLVQESARTDVDRAAGEYMVYRRFGRAEEAARALARAVAAGPDDPRVIEWQFVEAIQREKLDEAAPLADRARTLNCDGVDGLTFRARLQLARKDLTGAAQTIEQALGRSASNVALLRLLGNVRLALGRGTEALESYREALRLDPANIETIKAMVEALARLGQPDESLRVARQGEQFARHDPEFQHMLLGLEAALGNRAAAIAGRERQRALRPDDIRNGAALTALYLDAREWAKARALIDDLRGRYDGLELVGLDAAWYADQGDMNSAIAAYTTYIEKMAREAAGPMTSAPYLSLGSFLLARNQNELGLRALAEAAKHQGAGREGDLALGNAMFVLNRWEESAAALERALAGGAPDPDRAIAGRIVEALLMQDKPDEAAARLQTMGRVEDDAALSVLHAAIQERRGERRAARETLNRTVERFPNHQLAYYRRALLNGQEPAFRDDAMADLDQALRLAPGFWQARVARANIHLVLDRVNEAVADFRTAVEANPDLDDLRFRLITELVRRGREPEAFEIAAAGLRRRPNDADLAIGMGDIFARERLHARAAELYRSAWGSFRSVRAAALYATELMRLTPPNLREAEGVLTAAGLPVDGSPGLLMLRSRLRVLQGQGARAEADAVSAFKLAGAEPESLVSWHTDLLVNFPDASTRLRLLEGLSPSGGSGAWLDLFRALAALGIAERRSAAMDELGRIGETATGEPVLAALTYRALEGALRDDQKWEEAAQACMKGAAASPDDYVLHNNAAAILVEYLKRPADALPYAERAVALAPAAFEGHDTLASAYLALNKPAEAEESYRTALTTAYRPEERAKVLLPLIRLRMDAGDRDGAREFTEQIRRLLAAKSDVLNDQQKRDLEELEQRAR